MKIKSIFMLMTAVIITSCSKSEIEESATVDSNEISVASTVIDVDASTRTPYEGTISSTNKLKALVLASQDAQSYATVYANGTMEFSAATVVDYDKPMNSGVSNYPAGLRVYLTGLHPSSGWSVTGGEATLTMSGKEDVMLATRQESLRGSGSNQALAFTHQLTLMKLFFHGDADAVNSNETTVTSVELIKANGADLPNTATAKLSDATQTIDFSGSVAKFDCYASGNNTVAFSTPYVVTTTAPNMATDTEQAYVIAPPVQASNIDATYEYTFKIKYTNGSSPAVAKEMDVNVDLKDLGGSTSYNAPTAGNAFNIAFRFMGNQIQAAATVTAWTLAGNVNMDI